MEQKLGRTSAMILAVLSAAAAFGLRLYQIHTIYDELGYIIAGAGRCFFTYFTVAVVLLFAVYTLLLRPRKKYAALAGRSLAVCLGGCAAALGLVLGCAAMLLSPVWETDRYLAAGGLLTALCWLAVAILRYRGRKAPIWLFLVPLLFFAARLVISFRFWSRDPAILDYCYDLFAHIGIMCALLHMGSFCFDKGKRRITVFFCLCGVFFGAASLAGARPRDLCITGGAIVWLLSNLWLLLRPKRKRQPEEADGTDAGQADENEAAPSQA